MSAPRVAWVTFFRTRRRPARFVRGRWVAGQDPIGIPAPFQFPPGFVFPGQGAIGLPPSPGMPGTFTWNRLEGDGVMSRLDTKDPSGRSTVTLTSENFRQGLMSILFRAEDAARQAGLVVPVPIPGTSETGLVVGGGEPRARALLADASAPAGLRLAADLYVKTIDGVRAGLDRSRAAADGAPLTFEVTIGGTTAGALPAAVLVALVVVGIAAIAGGVYLAQKNIEVDAQQAIRLKALGIANDFAAQGKPIPKDLAEILGLAVKAPEESGGGGLSTGLVIGGLAAAAAAIYFATRKAA